MIIRSTWGKSRVYRKTQVNAFFLVAQEKNSKDYDYDIIREAEGKQ